MSTLFPFELFLNSVASVRCFPLSKFKKKVFFFILSNVIYLSLSNKHSRLIELQNDRSLSMLSRLPIGFTCYIEKLFFCRAMFITFILHFISHSCKNIDCTTSRSDNPSTNSTLVANSKVVKISMSKTLKIFSERKDPLFSARENRCVFLWLMYL